MFVQVIRGRVDDAAALKRLVDRWNTDVRPGAEGFLGSTSGVTAEGQAVALVRFRDAAAAAANSARPEQSAWWAEAEKCFDGAVSFRESEDVAEYLGGGSDAAGFVQVMDARCTDLPRLRELEQRWLPRLEELRPDLLGGYTIDYGEGRFTEVAYFTSEAAARAAEAQEMPDDLTETFAESQTLFAEIEYLDLTDPWLT